MIGNEDLSTFIQDTHSAWSSANNFFAQKKEQDLDVDKQIGSWQHCWVFFCCVKISSFPKQF
jgi:hypothetical protein